MSKKSWKNKGKDIPNVEIVKVAYNFCKKYNNIKPLWYLIGRLSLSALACALYIEKLFGVSIDPVDLLEDEPLQDIVTEIADVVRDTGLPA